MTNLGHPNRGRTTREFGSSLPLEQTTRTATLRTTTQSSGSSIRRTQRSFQGTLLRERYASSALSVPRSVSVLNHESYPNRDTEFTESIRSSQRSVPSIFIPVNCSVNCASSVLSVLLYCCCILTVFVRGLTANFRSPSPGSRPSVAAA
jgi:hypothetical protein